PGFSTAEKVTNVSGRGVGMDVVRTNIERIGGTIELQGTRGIGTTIKIKIPLTLAIIPALIVASDENRYAIPQASLHELVRLEGATIVGDGRVALILDVLGLAKRARVVAEGQQRARLDHVVGGPAADEPDQQTMLVFRSPDDGRMAIPLSRVARLEEIPHGMV